VRRTTTWTIALVTSLAVSGATGTAVAAAATSPQPQTQTQDRSAFVAADGHTYDYASGTTSDPRAAGQVAKIRTLLPADWRSRQAAALARFGVEPSAAQDALGRAIDPTHYQCAPTRLDAFVDGVLADIDPSSLFVLSMLGGFDFPTYDALLFGSTDDPAYALTTDSRNELTSSFRAAQKFWDTDGTDIQLMAMHGDVMRDPARLARLIGVLYGVDDTRAAQLAALVVDVVTTDPGLARGDSPIFTLNAFAFSGQGDPDPVISSLPDKLVFGDGMLDALGAIGVGDVGPRAVLGHEYGHHVQYDKNLFASPLTGPEATRRTELMADAFGTYFVTHKRGLALNTKRVLEAEQSFYQVGDCAFTNAGHHGTPNQRLRASTWGASVAADAQKQGQVLPSLTLDSRFESALPQFVAPDA
jgi:hypothetical protein